MQRLALICGLLCMALLACAQPLTHQKALDDSAFRSCDDVLARALDLSADIHESAYMMELYPKSRGPAAQGLTSETTGLQAASWIASHDTKALPDALFYFIKGAYALRCRDTKGRHVELSGPSGAKPLELDIGSGKGEIWYFWVRGLPFNDHNAFVWVVTDVSLKSLTKPEEIQLIEHVKELLNARFVQSVYLRNDPWFLGTAPNSLIYLFTDSFPKMTLEEYKATKTLWCNENQNLGCKFYLIY